MAAGKRAVLAALLAGAMAITPASAHRMPEVYVTIGSSEVEGEAVTAFTFRLYAEDALKLLGVERDLVVDLSDPALHEKLAGKVAAKVETSGGSLAFFGGDVEGNDVFLYFTAPVGTGVSDAQVLSSVYEQWTNRINDERSGQTETTVFTQKGALAGHHH